MDNPITNVKSRRDIRTMPRPDTGFLLVHGVVQHGQNMRLAGASRVPARATGIHK